ncbi:MAG: response regulator [Gammaproteobacteria bacterium]|nr:response regulator [Gammaproteobacteria bacterium]
MSTPTEKQTVLIVEDSRTYAELLRRRIIRHLAFDVQVAGSLAAAREMLEVHGDRVFAAVLDLNLPDAPDGEVVDMVLEHGISVVVLTSNHDEQTRQAAVAKNVVDYVIKESIDDLDYIVQVLRRVELNQRTELLLVDDSPTARYQLRQHLQPYKYRVHEAGSGPEALACLEANPGICLVVTDHQMPGMDGFELVTALRKRASKERLAIIGISAESGGALSARFLKRGANDFLVKPFTQEEFACRVGQNVELVDLVREIRSRADRDYLTGAYNRHYLLEIGEKYLENARRKHLDLVVAVVDVDRLRGINERHGHEAGDAVLRAIAEQLDHGLRRTDVVARYDAEQFCLLTVNAGEACLDTFERLREAIADLEIDHGGTPIRVTVSIGVCRRIGDDLTGMIGVAEAQVDKAKREGRNRVFADPPSGASGHDPDHSGGGGR